MVSSTPLQIVVVGAGLIGPRHAQHVKDSTCAKLFGIVDLNPKVQELADSLECEYFLSIREMIDRCDQNNSPYPDGAIVCTPNATHILVSAELASYGIHLLVEKPLSTRPEDSKALKEYVESKRVRLLVGHHRRFNPYIIETKKNLDKLGNIIAVQGTWTLKKPTSYFEKALWRTNFDTGGGVLLINLVHDIDILQHLFGPVEKVYAELLKKQREYNNVDEGAALTLRFKNGICGTFLCADNVTSPFNFESGTGENPYIPFHEPLEGFYRIFGSNGTLSVPDMNLYHQASLDSKEERSWNHPVQKSSLVEDKDKFSILPFDHQLEHFTRVIRGTEKPSCDAEDGISALLCIDAVLRSIKTGLPQMVLGIDDVQPNFDILGLAHKKCDGI